MISIGFHHAQPATFRQLTTVEGRQFVLLTVSDADRNKIDLFFDTPEEAHTWALNAAQAIRDTVPGVNAIEEAPIAVVTLGGFIDMTAEVAADPCFLAAVAGLGTPAEVVDQEVCGAADPGDEFDEVGADLGWCERPAGHDGNHSCSDGNRHTVWPNARPGAYGSWPHTDTASTESSIR